jgi:hypothetical protein
MKSLNIRFFDYYGDDFMAFVFKFENLQVFNNSNTSAAEDLTPHWRLSENLKGTLVFHYN